MRFLQEGTSLTVGGSIIHVKPGRLSLSQQSSACFFHFHGPSLYSSTIIIVSTVFTDIMHDNVAYIKSSTGQMVSGERIFQQLQSSPLFRQCDDNVDLA